MKRTALLVTFVLVLGSVPVGMAYHRSVGAEERVLVPADEDDRQVEPSVPGDGEGYDDPYDVGTTHPSNCTDPSATPSGAVQAARADAFCGELVYNTQVPQLTHASPPDQHIPSDVGDQFEDNPVETFDVVRVRSVGTFPMTTCVPFCEYQPGGELAHGAFYDAAGQTPLFDDAENTSEEQPQTRWQTYQVSLMHPSATGVLQSQTQAWQMNGWTEPGAAVSYVAFVEDDNGNPIGDDRLSSITDDADLPPGAQPRLCGFTPDFSFATTIPERYCDFLFEYIGDQDDGDLDFRQYDHRCASPTYTCFDASSPAWRSQTCYVCTQTASGDAADDPFQVLHFVLAPHKPDCPATEPGVGLDSQGASAPYLAHDLDVFTSPTRLEAAPQGNGSVQPIRDWVESVVAPPTPEEVQRSTTTPDRVEPNADPLAGLEETSQHREDPALERSFDDPCHILLHPETPETRDPWVDIVDGDVVADTEAIPSGGEGTEADRSDQGIRDRDNTARTDVYNTTGKVGFFADSDDDGVYDQLDPSWFLVFEAEGVQYDAHEIAQHGAYPMLWDMRVTSTADGPAPADAGCRVHDFGEPGSRLPQVMDAMGYGPHTGLFQAVYLQEPTVATSTNGSADTVVPFPGGNNVYLLGSQAVHELWGGPSSLDQAENALDERVDDTLSELIAYADSVNGPAGAPDVQVPGQAFEPASDYEAQCPEPTGGFSGTIELAHDCQVDCTGDTIVTGYVFEVANEDGRLEDTDHVPPFHWFATGGDFRLGSGMHTWVDVDPFDGDAARNDAECSRPAHTEPGRCNRVG